MTKFRLKRVYIGWLFFIFLYSTSDLLSKGIRVKSFTLNLGTVKNFSISKEAIRFENVKKNLVDISLDQEIERVYILPLAKGHTVVTWFDEFDEVIEKWMIEVTEENSREESLFIASANQKKFLQRKVIRLEAKVFTWRDQDSDIVGINPNFESKIGVEEKSIAKFKDVVELPLALQGMQDRLDLLGAPKILLMEGAESSISLGGEIHVDLVGSEGDSSRKQKAHWKKIGLEMKFVFLEFIDGCVHLNLSFHNSNPEGSGFLLANTLQTQLRLIMGEEKEVAEFKLENELKENWGHSFFKKIPILSAMVGQNRSSNSQVHMRVWVKAMEEKAR